MLAGSANCGVRPPMREKIMTKFSTVIISIALSSMTFAQEKPRENSLKVDMPAFLQASGALLINWPKAEKCAEVYPDLAQDLVNGIQKFALAKEKELSLVNSILEKYQGTGFLNEIQAKVRNDHRSRVE